MSPEVPRAAPSHPSWRPVASLAAAALLLAAPAAAQSVTGGVLETSGLAVSGALVSFVDSTGVRRAGTLSGDDGAFTARLPRPGTYLVRVERIGLELLERPGVVVPRGGLGELRLVLRSRAIRLQDVVVDPGRACTVRPDDAGVVTVIWEEARKALSGAAWAREEGVLNFRLTRWKREWDARGRELLTESADTLWVRSPRPFGAVPPELLDEEGWVQEDGPENVFHGPDEGALLSTVFQEGHCFRLQDEGAPLPGLIGLAFQPLPDRKKPDIEGVFWLDRESGELRSLEFRYTGVPTSRSSPAGGRLTFARLPTGAWIVRFWNIRAPVFDTRRLVRLMEAGGAVLAVDAVPPPAG